MIKAPLGSFTHMLNVEKNLARAILQPQTNDHLRKKNGLSKPGNRSLSYLTHTLPEDFLVSELL